MESLESLMEDAQKGNQKAYGALLEQLSRIVRSYVGKKVASQEDVEDIVQETLISMHKARHTYDGTRPLKPWVMAIATYRMNDYFRKHYRVNAKEAVDFDSVAEFIPDDVTEEPGSNEYVLGILEMLPERQKQIVHMMKVDGYTAKEVAKKMDMSVSAVKVSAHRAYKMLKEKLEEQEQHG